MFWYGANPVDTKRKLNLHKTFRKRLGRVYGEMAHNKEEAFVVILQGYICRQKCYIILLCFQHL